MRGIGSPKGGGLPICQGANISSLRDLFIAAIKREEISSPPPGLDRDWLGPSARILPLARTLPARY